MASGTSIATPLLNAGGCRVESGQLKLSDYVGFGVLIVAAAEGASSFVGEQKGWQMRSSLGNTGTLVEDDESAEYLPRYLIRLAV